MRKNFNSHGTRLNIICIQTPNRFVAKARGGRSCLPSASVGGVLQIHPRKPHSSAPTSDIGCAHDERRWRAAGYPAVRHRFLRNRPSVPYPGQLWHRCGIARTWLTGEARIRPSIPLAARLSPYNNVVARHAARIQVALPQLPDETPPPLRADRVRPAHLQNSLEQRHGQLSRVGRDSQRVSETPMARLMFFPWLLWLAVPGISAAKYRSSHDTHTQVLGFELEKDAGPDHEDVQHREASHGAHVCPLPS